MEPEPPGAAFFLPGAGADPRRSEPEPESAPGPWRPGAGAAQKCGGSATLNCIHSAFCNYQICYDSLLITK